MRRNKPGIALNEIKPMPDNYTPPPGFAVMSSFIKQNINNDHGVQDLHPLSR